MTDRTTDITLAIPALVEATMFTALNMAVNAIVNINTM